jgi:predicted N-acyltransferase
MRDDLREDEQKEILHVLFDTLDAMQRQHGHSLYFSNVMHQEKILMEVLRERGYFRTFGLPMNYLDIEWGTFEEYIQYVHRMNPSTRGGINHEMNRNRNAGVMVRECDDIMRHHDRLLELLEMNFVKYGSEAMPFKRNYLECLHKNFGSELIVYSAEKDGMIIAVSVTVKHGTTATMPNVGVDYEKAKKDFTYFNIAYYAPIRGAIEKKIKRFYYGNALYRTKRHRGCKTENVYVYYKAATPFQAFMVRMWFAIHSLWMRIKLQKIKKVR